MEKGVVKQGRLAILLLISLAAALFISCSQGASGYGIVLWSADEELYHTGSIVKIIEDSTLRNSYTFKAAETGEKAEAEKFRLMFFKKLKAANEWLKFQAMGRQICNNTQTGLQFGFLLTRHQRVYKLE